MQRPGIEVSCGDAPGQASAALLEGVPPWFESLAGLGCWTIEQAPEATLLASALRCTSQALHLLGQDSNPPATVADLLALFHGDDQQVLAALLHRLVLSDLGQRGSCCCRLQAPLPIRPIRLDVECLGGAEGSVLVGTVRADNGALASFAQAPGQSQQPDGAACAANVGRWDWEIASHRLGWDSAMLRLYGWCPDQWAGTYQAWMAAIHGQDRDRIDAELQAALRGEQPFASCFHVVWPDGSIHQLLALAQTSFDPQGSPMRMSGVTLDPIELLAHGEALPLDQLGCQSSSSTQSSEAEIAEALALLRQAMHFAPVGMALCDPQQHTFLQVNPSLCHFFERNESALLMSSWQDLTHPDDLNADQAMAREMLCGQLNSYRIRKRFLRPNGSVVWGDLSVAALRQPDGRVNGILNQIIDISDMVHRQEQLKEQQLQLRLTLDSLLDPHVLLDVVRDHAGVVRDFRFADANESALHVLQATKETLLGSSLLSILPGINNSPLMDLLRQAVTSVDDLVLDDVADPTGSLVPANGFVELRTIRVNGVLSLTWRDVTERHHMMQRIAASEQQHRLLTENASDVVMLMRHGMIEWISPSLNRMLGWSPGRWVGHPFEQFVHRDDLGLANQCCQEDNHGGSMVTRLRLRDSHDQHHWVEAHSSTIFSETGLPDGIVASFRTVDQEVASEQELERRARFDDLTGLLNRSEMLERFRLLLTSRPGRVPMAVIFIDIDEFKHINDTFGHAGGDRVLKIMAQRIHQTLRKRDWAARIGGDEMLVVLYGLNDLAKAMLIGEKLRVAAQAPIDFGMQIIKVTISVGVTLATSAESVDTIIARADQAMYLAKQQGRDQVMAIPAAPR